MDRDNVGDEGPLAGPIKPIKIFYCYAREDKRFRKMLEVYLSSIKRSHWVSSWHDGMINAGEDWERKIDEEIRAANIILLLISPDFIASDYCYGVEMERALERHDAGEARVIPIILRPTYLEDSPFSGIQALPSNGRPLTRWTDRDDAFFDIAIGIGKAVKQLLPSQRTAEQWMEAGQGFRRLGRFKEALAAFNHVIDQAPFDLEAYMCKGEALLRLERYDEALSAFNQAIELVPMDSLSYGDGRSVAFVATLYQYKGDTLLLLRRFDESLIAYNQVIHIAESYGEGYRYGGWYYGKGLAFMGLQRYEEALSAFDQAINFDPNNESIFLYCTDKGNALLNLERIDEALKAYNQALTLNPDYARAHFCKGNLLMRLNRFKEALTAFERIIQLEPDSTDGYHGKGECLYRLRDYKASLDYYQKVVELDPNSYDGFCGIGNALSHLGRNREALDAFATAIRIDPNNPHTKRRQADILQDLGRHLESEVVLKGLDADRDEEENNIMRLLDEPEKLLDFCEQKLQKNPHHTMPCLGKLIALYKLERFKEAHEFYMWLFQSDPDLEERGISGWLFIQSRRAIEKALGLIEEEHQDQEDQWSEEPEDE
jgi:tetratricopeptide (TPR) repeat protein